MRLDMGLFIVIICGFLAWMISNWIGSPIFNFLIIQNLATSFIYRDDKMSASLKRSRISKKDLLVLWALWCNVCNGRI